MSGHGRSASGGSPVSESSNRIAQLMTQQPDTCLSKFLILGPWIGLFALSCLVLLYIIYQLASGQAVSNPRGQVLRIMPHVTIPGHVLANKPVILDSVEMVQDSSGLIAHVLYINKRSVAVLLQVALPNVDKKTNYLLFGMQSKVSFMGVEVIEERRALGIERGKKRLKPDRLERLSPIEPGIPTETEWNQTEVRKWI